MKISCKCARSLFVLLCAAVVIASAQDKRENTAIKPVPRDAGWIARHERFLERAKKGDVDVLFLGDSITEGWGKNGKEIWQTRYEALQAANFGIGGDRTEHVLWRLRAGKELQGIHPKVVVLMIGTNNTSVNSADEIAQGVTEIVHELRKQLPHGKVLLLGVFPRSAEPTHPSRGKIKDVNKQIAKLDDGKQVRYLDIGDKFLDADGKLQREIMYDALHLTPQGYKIWADGIQSLLDEMLRK